MRFLKKAIPEKIRSRLSLLYESYLDANRYYHSAQLSVGGEHRRLEHLESEIIRRYHVIEKGLCMSDFRPRFGVDNVRELICCLEQWNRQAKCRNTSGENIQVRAGRAALLAYGERHKKHGIDVSDVLPAEYLRATSSDHSGLAGTKPLERVSCEDRAAFRRVVDSRVSVRDFEVGQIPLRHLIQDAVEMAARTPSVCNRQTWRVHAFEGQRAQDVLSLQTGNRGFGHTIPLVLIVTSNMLYFTGTIERNQAWIDGGMFSMTLLLSLHAQGLGAVSLNWSVLNERDEALRNLGGIPAHERIIMLIGCGYPKAGAVVPLSLRRPTETFLEWHDMR
jgi:nitroreductase